MLTLLAVCVIRGSRFQNPGAAQLDRVLPPPTGQNGYEEYIRAAKMVTGRLLSPYESASAQPNISPGDDPEYVELCTRIKGMTFLAVKREEIQKFGGALDLVRAGSQKPVFDPRTELTPETLYPEFSYFKSLSRLFVAESYVKFADGDSAGGTRSMIDGLTFNYRISGGLLIAALVGASGSNIIFRAIEPRLSALSVQDCREIQALCAGLLAAPIGLSSAFDVERKSEIATARRIFQDPSSLSESYLGGEDYKSLSNLVKQEGSRDIQGDIKAASDALNEFYRGEQAKLKLPESKWFGADSELELLIKQLPPVVGGVISLLLPTLDNVVSVIARQRTQFRLLGLHGMILEYRWEHNKLPAKLSDVANVAQRFDPLSERDFVYTPNGDGYHLLSVGNRATGQIELNYQPPVDDKTPAHP